MAEHYAPTKRANKVADWIEVIALIRGVAVGSNILHEIGTTVGYNAGDVAVGLNAISRRAKLLGLAYPFKVASGGVAATATAADRAWTALLLMSSESPVRPQLTVPIAAAHLERLTAEALTSLYGPGTSALRFAWPSEAGRPPEFPDAVGWLAEKMRVPVGVAYRSPYAKDGGVDVVAWRPFPDGRSGFPVLLAQCTLEKDYRHKATDVEVRVWSGWLALDVDPATALAIPDVVAAGEDWNALAARTIVLDRVRLASLLAGSELERPRLAQVGSWTREQIDLIRESQ